MAYLHQPPASVTHVGDPNGKVKRYPRRTHPPPAPSPIRPSTAGHFDVGSRDQASANAREIRLAKKRLAPFLAWGRGQVPGFGLPSRVPRSRVGGFELAVGRHVCGRDGGCVSGACRCPGEHAVPGPRALPSSVVLWGLSDNMIGEGDNHRPSTGHTPIPRRRC